MKYLETIEKLHPDIIRDFLQTRQSSGISVELQHFILELQWAAEIWERERNISRAARLLQQRAFANQHEMMSLQTAKSRIYAAITYFDIDSNVPQQVWDRDTANKLEDVARLAIKLDRPDVAKSCMLEANDLRRRANDTEQANGRPIIFLMSPDVDIEGLGFKRKNLKEIARKAADGFYIKLITNLNVDKDEKKRLMRDAEVQDVEYEELPE